MKDKLQAMVKMHFSEFPSALGGSVGIKEIQQAEKKIGLEFSPEYRFFLKQFGGGVIGSLNIFGLKRASLMPKDHWSVVENTFFYRNTQNWPGIEDWYIISDDGSGNPIGCKPDGSVWLSDHDAGFKQVKLADTFEEFLYKLLTETLYE